MCWLPHGHLQRTEDLGNFIPTPLHLLLPHTCKAPGEHPASALYHKGNTSISPFTSFFQPVSLKIFQVSCRDVWAVSSRLFLWLPARGDMQASHAPRPQRLFPALRGSSIPFCPLPSPRLSPGHAGSPGEQLRSPPGVAPRDLRACVRGALRLGPGG